LCSRSTADTPAPHSFPTRRSSDLCAANSSASKKCFARPRFISAKFTCARTKDRLLKSFIGYYEIFRTCCLALIPILTIRSIRSRSEEHTSELQSRGHLVCRLLLEK